jgi:uncharacterized protein YecE (DUF72 family)
MTSPDPDPDPDHDPGPTAAASRAEAATQGATFDADDPVAAVPAYVGATTIRVGTAGWTDRTLTARGVFYPGGVSTPEARLRYYASRFSMVESDAGFYAIPDPLNTERWIERTPADFVFDVKAHALMTGHPTEIARLPKTIRDALPPALASGKRVYANDLPLELRDEIWRLFAAGVRPLHDAGKLGAILLQFAPWIRPARNTPAMFARARDQLGDLPIAMEFRHPTWLEPQIRERLWSQLRDNGMTYVVADTPPGTATSMPRVPAVTTQGLAIVRLHGRRSETWGARDASVAEKYRYLYDRDVLEEWLNVILGLGEQAERIHVVFNNCYANYGTTNAVELARLLNG